MAEKLTPKQQRFVDEYLKDLNATAAYKRAGYTATGRSAENNASRLLGTARVKAAIAEATTQRAQRTQLNADRVLQEYQSLAFNDLRDIFVTLPSGGLRVRPVQEWPESVGRSLAGIKIRQEMEKKSDGTFSPLEVIEFKLSPKTEALKALAQHLGLLKEVHEHTGEVRLKVSAEELSDDELAAIAQGESG